jgi:hypothetical protein
MTIATALTQMASILEANTDAVKAHANPPESLSEFPCFVLEWVRGDLGMTSASDTSNNLLTAVVALYANRQVLATSSAVARPFITSVFEALAGNASLNGAALVVEDIRFEGPGGLDYGGQQYFGIRFEVDVRFKDAVTFAL